MAHYGASKSVKGFDNLVVTLSKRERKEKRCGGSDHGYVEGDFYSKEARQEK